MAAPVQPIVRDARDTDAAGLIALLGGIFEEYPGCVLDVDGEMPQLRAIATSFAELGGRFWVAEAGGAVVGCIGLAPCEDGDGIELKHLYVARAARRTGLGTKFVRLVEAEAIARGASLIELWTDTRFADAHRLYAALGYERLPETRELHDLSNSVEYHFIKRLAR